MQGLLRETVDDVELHGVTIPAGSVLNLRYAAGNRDERQFERPEEIDLDRKGLRRHLAFGVGTHHCLGAPLARREMYYGFKALVDRVERLWFVEGANDFSHHQNFFLRALKEVHVGFEPVESWTKSEALPLGRHEGDLMPDLEGKVAVVTGGAEGIGRATADRDGAERRRVVVADVNETLGRETIGLRRGRGRRGALRLVRRPRRRPGRGAGRATVERFGGIDVLHNNAGVHESSFASELTVDTLPLDAWDAVYEINLRGRLVLHALRRAATSRRRRAAPRSSTPPRPAATPATRCARPTRRRRAASAS